MDQKVRKFNRSALGVCFDMQGQIASLSRNVSQSGMLCRTSRMLDEMTLLDIRFQLPISKNDQSRATWVECSGVVVRCEKKEYENREMPYEVAIFFDKISEKNKDILAEYCREKGR